MRIRKIKIYAGMWVIKLLPADVKDLGFFENAEVDIDDLKILGNPENKDKVKVSKEIKENEE